MNPFLEEKHFGKLADGREVPLFVLGDGLGFEVEVFGLGAAVRAIRCLDRDGKVEDMTLGFDFLDDYLGQRHFCGVTAGRVAGRIPKARFTLEGRTYQLPKNDGSNHLHGGPRGLDKQLWQAREVPGDGSSVGVQFWIHDPDGSNGHPGNVEVWLCYIVEPPGRLKVIYEARSDALAPVSLAHHSYFNLAGAGRRNILDQIFQIFSSAFYPVDEDFAPLPEPVDVTGLAADFRQPTRLGDVIEGLHASHGDLYRLDGPKAAGGLRHAARVFDPESGRQLDVFTDEPCLQLYTMSVVPEPLCGKNGQIYHRFGGFCLECEAHPGLIGRSEFDGHVARPGLPVRHETVYCFSLVS